MHTRFLHIITSSIFFILIAVAPVGWRLVFLTGEARSSPSQDERRIRELEAENQVLRARLELRRQG